VPIDEPAEKTRCGALRDQLRFAVFGAPPLGWPGFGMTPQWRGADRPGLGVTDLVPGGGLPNFRGLFESMQL